MSEKQRILVVEDDEIMQRALAVSLEKANFEVTSVASIEETTSALSNFPFSIVITDVYLPDGNGLQVFDLVCEKQPQTPVLAMTGYGHTELGRKAKKLFGSRLFEKPFKKKVLIGKVQTMIGNG